MKVSETDSFSENLLRNRLIESSYSNRTELINEYMFNTQRSTHIILLNILLVFLTPKAIRMANMPRMTTL